MFVLNLKLLIIMLISVNQSSAALTLQDLDKFKEDTRILFENGLVRHTLETSFHFKRIPEQDNWKLIHLKSKSPPENEISISFTTCPKEQLVFHINGKNFNWKVKYPEVQIFDSSWHKIIYRLGQNYLKVWVDCKLLVNAKYHSNVKTVMHEQTTNTTCFAVITGHSLLRAHTCKMGLYDAFNDLSSCSSAPKENSYISKYYYLNENCEIDVSQYFQNGIFSNYSFEFEYHILRFPSDLIKSIEIFTLMDPKGDRLIIEILPSRNILRIEMHRSNKFDKSLTEIYEINQISNTDWHTIKYTIQDSKFILWFDNERKIGNISGKTEIELLDSNENYWTSWSDIILLLLKPYSNDEPIVGVKEIKFHGKDIIQKN